MSEIKTHISETSIQNSLVRFLRDQLDVELPSTSTNLIDAGILDSLMLTEIVLHIEENFSVPIELDDLEIENFITVDSMARFLAARLPSSGIGEPEGPQTVASSRDGSLNRLG